MSRFLFFPFTPPSPLAEGGKDEEEEFINVPVKSPQRWTP